MQNRALKKLGAYFYGMFCLHLFKKKTPKRNFVFGFRKVFFRETSSDSEQNRRKGGKRKRKGKLLILFLFYFLFLFFLLFYFLFLFFFCSFLEVF